MTEGVDRQVDRQLPIGGEIFLDHVAHFVADPHAAAQAIIQAGFLPTPVSVQTNPGPNGTRVPAGTGNITAMLTRGYIEVLFKTAETPLAAEFDAELARYPGLHLLAFAVADAAAASARLKDAGFRTAPVVALRRPVATQTCEAEAAFTVARIAAGDMREGRIQYLTHHTEDAVWQKRWVNHANGARALIDAVVAVADVAEATARFQRFLGRAPQRTALGEGFFLDRGGVQIVETSSFQEILGGADVPALPFIGCYALRVDSLAQTQAVLSACGLEPQRLGPLLIQPFPPALGAGAWLFVERSGDLPWRR